MVRTFSYAKFISIEVWTMNGEEIQEFGCASRDHVMAHFRGLAIIRATTSLLLHINDEL
jgi:hypothetical protein